MNKEEIKQKIHNPIDEMDDEAALQMLYEEAVEYTASSTVASDELTEDQWLEIDKGLEQIENGETYTATEVVQHFKEWRTTK